MPFAAIVIGAILLVVALRNTQGDFGDALATDFPGFFKWTMAIGFILGLGFIPGMEKPSRWLLALVALVIVLTQYNAIINGFKSFAGSSGQPSGTPTPSPDVTSSQDISKTPTSTAIEGTAGDGTQNMGFPAFGVGSGLVGVPSPAQPSTGTGIFPFLTSPSSVLSSVEKSIGFGGFGG